MILQSLETKAPKNYLMILLILSVYQSFSAKLSDLSLSNLVDKDKTPENLKINWSMKLLRQNKFWSFLKILRENMSQISIKPKILPFKVFDKVVLFQVQTVDGKYSSMQVILPSKLECHWVWRRVICLVLLRFLDGRCGELVGFWSKSDSHQLFH